MARIRTIKPEFWHDEKLGPLAPLTRLVFLGLVSMADDAGRLLDNGKVIDAFIFPYTDDTAGSAVDELWMLGRIERGVTDSGQRVIQITNWTHQKVDHPNLKAALPPLTTVTAITREGFATASRAIRDSISTSDQLPATNEREAAGAARPVDNPIGQVMAAVRLYLYVPDGKPPADWSDSRDASIAQTLLKRGDSVSAICDAIEGIRLAVDRGALADWTPPARKGDKLTLRILYHTKHGVLPTWTVAMNALGTALKGAA